MAMVHPTRELSHDRSDAMTDGKTRHPMLCLAGGFGLIIGAALLVHVVFNALI